MQHYRRSPSADFSHLSNGIRKRSDNTVRITMTTPTHIQNQPLVSHIFLTFQRSTRQSFAASATAERVAATIHELQSIGGQTACSFQKRGHSPQIDHLSSQVCLVVLSRPGSNADTNEPRLLRTTAAATTVARPSGARGQHHVSWPFARPTDASVSHTTLNVIPFSTTAYCEPPERELHRS